MATSTRHHRDEWVPNTYPSRRVGDFNIRIARTGKPIWLTAEEDAQFSQFFMADDLFDRLQRTGHIMTQSNSAQVFAELSQWLAGTYDGPGLHIVVPTRRCNLNCTYCHMLPQQVGSSRATNDLQPETIPHLVRFILSSPKPALTIEFQGGEPFLNFAAVQATVEEIQRQNAIAQKNVRFALVSNLMVATDEQLAYCYAHKIRVSFTLNGPKEIHDRYRVNRLGRGSYDSVMKRFENIRAKFPGLLASYPLCVVTEENAPSLTELFEYYYGLGFTNIGTIWLKNLGNAVGSLTLNMDTALPHYGAALDYVYERNARDSACYSERLAQLALQKILGTRNPLFVDWRNPIGYFVNCIVYDVDGEILPVDEARSLRQHYSLGNVRTSTYDEVAANPASYRTVDLSIRDRDAVCRECAYNPYCGVSPVLHFGKTGRPEPEPHVSDECKLVLFLFDWIFAKAQRDPLPLLRMLPDLMKTLEKQSVAGAPSLVQTGGAPGLGQA